ncbi:hypothetical protein SLS62_003662 [Diatrype stigma]|uniref:BTB domain-containing protein n=1 Tax=Diatrype stigma TaxID=117547 RepID=A0AAN9YU42_9PEZI
MAMDTAWADNLHSHLFEFCVGPEKKVFTIHSASLLRLSPYFVTLISGDMREAHDRRVEWDDIDEETFIIFAQFVYTGNYNIHELPPDSPGPKRNEETATRKARDQYASSAFRTSSILDWVEDIEDKGSNSPSEDCMYTNALMPLLDRDYSPSVRDYENENPIAIVSLL